MKKDKLIRVGRYIMHDAVTTVWADPCNESSHIDQGWTDEGYLKVVVSIKASEWKDVLENAIHEVGELAFRLFHGCYTPDFTGLRPWNTDRYMFMFSHSQWSMMAQHMGDYLAFLLPDLRDIYLKERKRIKRK